MLQGETAGPSQSTFQEASLMSSEKTVKYRWGHMPLCTFFSKSLFQETDLRNEKSFILHTLYQLRNIKLYLSSAMALYIIDVLSRTFGTGLL